MGAPRIAPVGREGPGGAGREGRARAQYRTDRAAAWPFTMAFVTGADVMAQARFVVEVSEPVPGERVGEVAARIAGRFSMDEGRVRKLLQDRTGAVTKPLTRDKADRIAVAFRDAGVLVRVASASRGDAGPGGRGVRQPRRGAPAPGTGAEEPPANVFLSSTRWVPSPHEEADAGALVEGLPAAVLAEPGTVAAPGPAEAPSAPSGPTSVGSAKARGRRVRTVLVAALAVCLVAFLGLQALYRARVAGATQASTAAGMEAYASGDFAQARRLWTPLAESGNAQAQYMLGYMAANGQGRPWSNHDAAGWYRRAADQGYPQAQVALGQLYLRGMGVVRDPQTATQLFRAAAHEGYGQGQFQYALALFHGTGVAQDFGAALRWFKAAAANGVAEARPYVSFAGSASGAGQAATPQDGQAQPSGPSQTGASAAPTTGGAP